MEFQEASAREAGIRGIRYLQSGGWTAGFGHLALLDIFVKGRKLGVIRDRHVVLARRGQVANSTYLKIWSNWIQVETDERRINGYDTRLAEEYPAVLKVNGEWRWLHDALAIVETAWQASGRRHFLKLSDAQINRGWSEVSRFGISRGDWFVALHVRENGLVSGGPTTDSLRNAAPGTYGEAIGRITRAGGHVIKLGKETGTPNGLLDVFLLSQARFVIATNSGPAWVAGSFGVPVLLTNWAPIGITYHYANAVVLPKRLWSTTRQRLLTEEEHGAEPFAWLEGEAALAEHGVVQVPNTPEEIAAAVAAFL